MGEEVLEQRSVDLGPIVRDTARARARGTPDLGLSIVAGIVEAHGGEVSVAAAPNRGATFRIRLPRSVRGTA